MTSTTSNLLHCVDIETGTTRRVVLFRDAEVVCYQWWQSLLFVLLALLLTAPVVIVAFALRYGKPAARGTEPLWRIATREYLMSPYHSRVRWWHAVVMTQLLLLATVRSFVSDPITSQIVLQVRPCHGSGRHVTLRLAGRRGRLHCGTGSRISVWRQNDELLSVAV